MILWTTVQFLTVYIAVTYAFAAFGVYFFGNVPNEVGPNDQQYTFKNFSQAMLQLFQMTVGNNWNSVLYPNIQYFSRWASLYFVLYFATCTTVFTSIIESVVIDAHQLVHEKLDLKSDSDQGLGAAHDINLGPAARVDQLLGDDSGSDSEPERGRSRSFTEAMKRRGGGRRSAFGISIPQNIPRRGGGMTIEHQESGSNSFSGELTPSEHKAMMASSPNRVRGSKWSGPQEMMRASSRPGSRASSSSRGARSPSPAARTPSAPRMQRNSSAPRGSHGFSPIQASPSGHSVGASSPAPSRPRIRQTLLDAMQAGSDEDDITPQDIALLTRQLESSEARLLKSKSRPPRAKREKTPSTRGTPDSRGSGLTMTPTPSTIPTPRSSATSGQRRRQASE